MDDSPTSAHRRTWDLIPWVLNGSASDAERREVEAHVAGCTDCADELAFQRQLHAAMTANAQAPHDPNPALRRLWSRIGRADAEALPAPSGRGARRREIAVTPLRWTRLLVAAVVVQAIGLAALVGIVSERPRSADYETLSRSPAAAGAARIRLVPVPSLRIGELRDVLARHGLQVVESSADATILGVAPRPGVATPIADVLSRLRAEPGVALAEPVATLAAEAAASARASAGAR